MAKFEFKGIEEYVAKLNELQRDSEDTVKRALYAGAGVVADSIKPRLSGIPTRDPDKFYKDSKAPGPTPQEKADLIANFGIARMKTEGTKITTKVGINGGYSSHKTKNFPQGVPLMLIARSIESGTSWMQKHPVFRQASNSAKAAAEAAMKRALEEAINQHMN